MDFKSPTRSERGSVTVESLTAIVVAYLHRNDISPSDLPPLVARLQYVLSNGHDNPSVGLGSEPEMRVNLISKDTETIHDEYLVCLEDGKRFKSLKRHLKTKYGMTPEEYRQKWNLPADYPMVAPSYARKRSKIALGAGLGTVISRRTCKD